MSKTVLITGANGRLGQALTGAFVEAGWHVHAQVRRQPTRAPSGVHWVHVPLQDPAALADTVRAASVSRVGPTFVPFRNSRSPLTVAIQSRSSTVRSPSGHRRSSLTRSALPAGPDSVSTVTCTS